MFRHISGRPVRNAHVIRAVYLEHILLVPMTVDLDLLIGRPESPRLSAPSGREQP